MYKAHDKLISGITDFRILRDRQIPVLARLSALRRDQLQVTGDARHTHGLRFGLGACRDRAGGRMIQDLPTLLPWAVSLQEDACLHLIFPFICLYLFLKATQGVGLVGSSGKMNHLAVSDARTPGLPAMQ